MNLRDVANFIVAGGEQRLEPAARKLSLTVDQLRASIHRLEQAVGTTLLVDGPNGVRLTSAGVRFRFRARHVLDGLREFAPTRMHFGDVEIDVDARTVSVANRLVTLTDKEFQLLATIASERGAVCRRERLINDIWSRHGVQGQNTLNVHITTLRAKLGRPDLILTIRGVVYRMATATL